MNINVVSDQETIKLLEDFLINNPELTDLENRLEEFNIFDALGAIWVEIRHSEFLAFLLNPSQNHGLGDAFLKSLLQRSIPFDQAGIASIRPIDLDLMDMDECLVLREWQNIDILIIDEHNRFVTIIENKVISGEHDDQLQRYRKIVNQQYPGYRQLCLFLTPEGETPSDPTYIPINYTLIANLIEGLVESHSASLKPDVRMLMIHYSLMLRRYIVSDSEIAELCQKIYRKHQRALDLIYEYRPDLQEEIRELLESLIKENEQLALDHSSKSYIRFAPTAWDTPLLLQGQGWTRSGKIMLFEIGNFADRLGIYLIIGPGPEETRRKLFDLAKENRQVFTPAFIALGKSYNTIFKRSFLTPKSYESASIADLEAEIRKKWNSFLEHDLPEIMDFFAKQTWIWE
jgi:hypothetical protein